jgi:RNA polymerase sigma-70 factor (ECF subfamily)
MTPQEYNKSVDEYSDNIYRFVLKSLGDGERAKDIVQDSYEKLWINVIKIDYSKAKAWLFSTAYNTMVDIIRKDKKLLIGTQPESEDLSYSRSYSDLNEILHNYVDKLPDKWKSVLLLRDYEGYSYFEISDITGQTEAQVKINIYRARMALRKMIGKIEILI